MKKPEGPFLGSSFTGMLEKVPEKHVEQYGRSFRFHMKVILTNFFLQVIKKKTWTHKWAIYCSDDINNNKRKGINQNSNDLKGIF